MIQSRRGGQSGSGGSSSIFDREMAHRSVICKGREACLDSEIRSYFKEDNLDLCIRSADHLSMP